MRRHGTARLFAILAVGSLLWGGAGRLAAEVGGTFDPATGTPSQAPLYILLGIGDDPEPIGWVRYNPDEPGRLALNEQGAENGDGLPSLLFNTVSATPLVAWARNSAQGFDIVISRLSGGAWSDPEVLAGSPLDELDPHLSMDPATGDVHLFYWVRDETPRVMHRQAPSDLSSWSAPVQVSDPSDAAARPTGIFHGGELFVAYELHDWGFEQTPRQIVLARRVGPAFQPEIVAITHYADAASPHVRSHGGRLFVDWIDSDNEVAWTRRDASGTWEPVRTEPYGSVEQRDFQVRPGIRIRALQE